MVNRSLLPAPSHGGDLAQATQLFGQTEEGWQDLSTGISPWSYPVPPVPSKVWQRLPGEDTPLLRAAGHYYDVEPQRALPLPGSQYAIARLPHLLPLGRVALPVLGYEEHRRAWASAGHQVKGYHSLDELQQWLRAKAIDHLVVINPNNPTAEMLSRETLHDLYQALQQHRSRHERGLMLVDEAFVDLHSHLSVLPLINGCPDLWVLRSCGKFFGLAGLRLGFLLGYSEHRPLAERLKAELEPWGLSHPAQWIGVQALEDHAWQRQQWSRLHQASLALEQLWQGFCQSQPTFGAEECSLGNAGLFVTLKARKAGKASWEPMHQLYQALGEKGLLLRWCNSPADQPAWLRCGLPVDGGTRLQAALKQISLTKHFPGASVNK